MCLVLGWMTRLLKGCEVRAMPNSNDSPPPITSCSRAMLDLGHEPIKLRLATTLPHRQRRPSNGMRNSWSRSRGLNLPPLAWDRALVCSKGAAASLRVGRSSNPSSLRRALRAGQQLKRPPLAHFGLPREGGWQGDTRRAVGLRVALAAAGPIVLQNWIAHPAPRPGHGPAAPS